MKKLKYILGLIGLAGTLLTKFASLENPNTIQNILGTIGSIISLPGAFVSILLEITIGPIIPVNVFTLSVLNIIVYFLLGLSIQKGKENNNKKLIIIPIIILIIMLIVTALFLFSLGNIYAFTN